MKNEDFDRLKKLCDENGFEMSYDHKDCETFNISTKKDIWEGVDFVECVLNSESYTVGKIYPIDRKFLPKIKTKHDDFLNSYNGHSPSYLKPSTEQAYVDQLKAKAFELYGEIKIWDRFDRLEFPICSNGPLPQTIIMDSLNCNPSFRYFKSTDSLEFDGYIIYQKGKWAKKAPKRIEVTLFNASLYLDHTLRFEFKVSSLNFDITDNLKKSITSHLEKYVNGEIENP